MPKISALRSPILVLSAVVFLVDCAANAPAQESGRHAFQFRDVGEKAGLFPAIEGIQGHAAGWGDADGDGWIDLYVGTFHRGTAKSNRLLWNERGTFKADSDPALQISTRATGALWADLDNDGDLDLYVASMPSTKQGNVGCSLFRNEGQRRFVNISEGNGACPTEFGGRSATVLDYDGDGLLDLLVGEDPLPGYNGSKTKSSRLFRNLGDLKFEDVTQRVGIPEGVPGLGVAVQDLNDDGWPDLFLCASGGGNRLFLNDRGKFREAVKARETFAWKDAKGDDMVCGICFADVNGDGLPDAVLGPHYQRPWAAPIGPRLYLHRGIVDGEPRFEDVTEAAGLKPLPMKAPHVEFQDFDNDGRPDLLTTMVKFADGEAHPVIFKNRGVQNGIPQFTEDALAVNSFPTAEDLAVRRTGDFFARMIERKQVIYTAPGPSADFDNDGRLDLFLCNWWEESRSMLLRNETPSGHWLQVRLDGLKDVNRMGIGARIDLYRAGQLGAPNSRLASRELSIGFGYASCQPAIAHFGLGEAERVDMEIVLPHGRGRLQRRNIVADQRLVITSKETP